MDHGNNQTNSACTESVSLQNAKIGYYTEEEEEDGDEHEKEEEEEDGEELWAGLA